MVPVMATLFLTAVEQYLLRDRLDCVNKLVRVKYPPGDAILYLYLLGRRLPITFVDRSGRVLQQEAPVATVVRLANDRVDAHVSRDARDDDVCRSKILQNEIEIRVPERTLGGFVDYRFVLDRCEFVGDVKFLWPLVSGRQIPSSSVSPIPIPLPTILLRSTLLNGASGKSCQCPSRV